MTEFEGVDGGRFEFLSRFVRDLRLCCAVEAVQFWCDPEHLVMEGITEEAAESGMPESVCAYEHWFYGDVLPEAAEILGVKCLVRSDFEMDFMAPFQSIAGAAERVYLNDVIKEWWESVRDEDGSAEYRLRLCGALCEGLEVCLSAPDVAGRTFTRFCFTQRTGHLARDREGVVLGMAGSRALRFLEERYEEAERLAAAWP